MIDKWLTRIEWGMVCLTFPLASILAFLQVSIRWLSKYYPDFVNNHTFDIMQWSPELIGYTLITGALFGASLGVKSNAHIGVDVVTKKFPPKIRIAVDLIILVITVVFLVYIGIYSYFYVENERAMNILPDHLPGAIWMYHAPLTLALLLMAYRYGQQTFQKWRGGHSA